jgi:hypothetical protein
VRTILLAFLVALLALPAISLGHSERVHKYVANSHGQTVVEVDDDEDDSDMSSGESRNFDIKKKTVIVKYRTGTPRRVEVNERYELLVDGTRVKLDREQQELVNEFYNGIRKLIDDSKEIGLEGAAIGAQGAGIAAKAVAGVFEMLFTDYTSDDLERDVDRAAAKVEARANRLEAKANRIEKQADQVEKLYDEMEDSIPELHRGI